MNKHMTETPPPVPDADRERDMPPCTLIITVESGVVADILPTGPIEAVIVDLDMLENDDTFEQRMRKSVLPMIPESRILSNDVSTLITTIVQEYRRPGRKRPASTPDGKRAA